MNLFDLAMTVRPLFLAWMVAIFLYIVWRAFSPARREAHNEHGMIPLRDAGARNSSDTGLQSGAGR